MQLLTMLHDISKFTSNFHVVRNYLYTDTWSCAYLATTECDKAEILLKHRWSHHWRGILEECCSGSWVGTFTSNSFLCSFLPVDCWCVALEVIVEAWADLWAQEVLPKKELCVEAMTAVDYSLDWYQPINWLFKPFYAGFAVNHGHSTLLLQQMTVYQRWFTAHAVIVYMIMKCILGLGEVSCTQNLSGVLKKTLGN